MHSEIYADERAREMEASAQRRMGCSPLGRMISVIMKCNGRNASMRKERMDYAMAYSPAQTSYMRPAARTVTIATTAGHRPAHAHAAPPDDPPQVYAVRPGALMAAAPPRGAGGKPRKKKKKSKRVRFTLDGPALAPHVAPEGMTTAPAAAAASGHHHPAGGEPYSPAAHVHGYYGHGQYSRYAPSPLARWEMLGGAGGTPRRYEYFSGEYRWCYPTPVREGIYSIATDANRLTTIFSEENPNACTIV